MLGALPNLAEEEAEDADVEQDAAPDELLAPEELARLGAPSVLAAIEACPAAEEEDRHADIREDAEQEVLDVSHGSTPCGLTGGRPEQNARRSRRRRGSRCRARPARTAGRRGGRGCVSTCRSRGWPVR